MATDENPFTIHKVTRDEEKSTNCRNLLDRADITIQDEMSVGTNLAVKLHEVIQLKRIADALENFNYTKVGEIVHMTVVQKAEK